MEDERVQVYCRFRESIENMQDKASDQVCGIDAPCYNTRLLYTLTGNNDDDVDDLRTTSSDIHPSTRYCHRLRRARRTACFRCRQCLRHKLRRCPRHYSRRATSRAVAGFTVSYFLANILRTWGRFLGLLIHTSHYIRLTHDTMARWRLCKRLPPP